LQKLCSPPALLVGAVMFQCALLSLHTGTCPHFFYEVSWSVCECLVWNTVFSFYCAIGRQFGKLLVLIAPAGGEEILQAYLAQTKFIAFENKRPNVLAKMCVGLNY